MVDPNPISPLPHRPPFPGLSRLGVAVIAVGLLLDLVEHDLGANLDPERIAGFAASEHAAHLVVVVGMVLVLGGIVRAGRRLDHRRPPQPRSSSHAIR